MIFNTKRKESYTLIRSDGNKLEKLTFNLNDNNRENINLFNKLYSKINLLIYSYELTNNIKFSDLFSREVLVKLITKQIIDGYSDVKDIDELDIIGNDIIGEIFNILKNNDMLEPSMNDIMRIVDNMRISSISKDAKYYYETVLLKEKKKK